MTPSDPNDEHLADLRRRWEEDPGSRIFLQLAEEYRRAGRNEEALEVLEKGMEAHPQQVSGLVSLGRIHLALDQPGEAAEALEKAVEIDPTNPMAMKLATEAHLQAGDRAMAKQRLDLYKLLNAGDEDTDSLEARVEGREPATPATPEPPAEEGASDDQDAEAAPSGSWSPTAAWPSLPKGDGGAQVEEPAGEGPPVEPAEAADAVAGGYASEFTGRGAEEAPEDDRPEPFADLLSDAEESEYLSSLAAEGIFPQPEADTEAPAEPDVSTDPEVSPDDEPFPDLAAEPGAEAGEDVWQLEDGDVADDVASLPAKESGEDALVVRDEALPAAAPDADLPAPTAPATLARDAARETPDDGPRPTVTLGQLYLDQGHPDEALAIFDAVLERDPGHEAAAAGRRAALAQREGEAGGGGDGLGEAPAPGTAPAGFSLEAGELLRGADPSKPRKVALLEAYLDRIRGERAS